RRPTAAVTARNGRSGPSVRSEAGRSARRAPRVVARVEARVAARATAGARPRRSRHSGTAKHASSSATSVRPRSPRGPAAAAAVETAAGRVEAAGAAAVVAVVAAAARAVERATPDRRSGVSDEEVRRTPLPSGLRIVTASVPTSRSVTGGAWVGSGARDEAPARSGASHFLEHLLFKGTDRR